MVNVGLNFKQKQGPTLNLLQFVSTFNSLLLFLFSLSHRPKRMKSQLSDPKRVVFSEDIVLL